MRHFLIYWTTGQLQRAIANGSLPHAGSGQLNRVANGDRLWVCGRLHDDDELFTIGFIDVDKVLTKAQAQAEMDTRVRGYKVWPANWHVLAMKERICNTRAVSMAPLYRSLTFDSKASRRLELNGGHPNAQQLQTMRRLTPDGATRLQELWGR